MSSEDFTQYSACAEIATSTWADALDAFGIQGVLQGLQQRTGGRRVAGRAITVQESHAADESLSAKDFDVGRIIEAIEPGGVVLIASGGVPVSTFGALAARASVRAGAAGVVIDGACRDVAEIGALGLWLASRHVTPTTGKRRLKVETVGCAVELAGCCVNQDDLVVADETGIVVVPQHRFQEICREARRLHLLDGQIDRDLAAGVSFRAATSAANYM